MAILIVGTFILTAHISRSLSLQIRRVEITLSLWIHIQLYIHHHFYSVVYKIWHQVYNILITSYQFQSLLDGVQLYILYLET
jgi:hypothetical protein